MTKFSDLSLRVRRGILNLGFSAGKNGFHLGSSLSIVDILAVLYSGVLNISKLTVTEPERDRFILSKGHAAVALYALLVEKGFLDRSEVNSFESNGSDYYAHAHRNLSRGIEFSGGSLSLGLSYGVGVAISCKRANISNRIVVLVGDGECDEGLVWESAMAASNFCLSNLTVIVDVNGMQSDGNKSEIMNSSSLVDKFNAFGFNSFEVDGHNHALLDSALRVRHDSRPTAVIAYTVKGKGVSFAEGNPDWHHGVLTKTQFEVAIAELDSRLHNDPLDK